MSTSDNKIFEDITNAFAEAAKTNAEYIKQGFDLLKDTVNMPFNLSQILSESNSTLSKGFISYLKLNAEHASNLLDLSSSLSRELLSSLERSGWQTKATAKDQPEPGQAVSELHMNGFPGDLCRSAFIIESRKSQSVFARVYHSHFVHDQNGSTATIAIMFNPVEVMVKPGEKIRITVEVGIPSDILSGTYQSLIWIEGFPELCLRVLLKIADAPNNKNNQYRKNSKQNLHQKAKKTTKKR